MKFILNFFEYVGTVVVIAFLLCLALVLLVTSPAIFVIIVAIKIVIAIVVAIFDTVFSVISFFVRKYRESKR